VKIAISYPPLPSEKGTPLLSQNRQFQWFKNPTYIYPMIPGYAATMLKRDGHEVVWDDGIAECLTHRQWQQRFMGLNPDLVAMESKTPVVERHWRIIGDLKDKCEGGVKTVLFGDHVTAYPQESMEKSRVDFVITGGDYDFVLTDLCRHLQDPAAAGMPRGVWYREAGRVVHSGPPDLSHDLGALPFMDRELTRWELYAYRNGNFKHPPGTYTMAGRDCWWGRCRFCSWTTLYPGISYRVIPVSRHLDEIGMLIERYPVREIFDDSGCFPAGPWLRSFCEGILTRGYHKKVRFGCNMRVGALTQEEFGLMKQANFRFILIGIESFQQETLNRLNKGIQVEDITRTLAMARKAGLSTHITFMMGYPWETRADALATVERVKDLFRRGLIETLQATIVVPYPGTALFEAARQKGWLLTENWQAYDMKQSVWKSAMTQADVLRFTRDLYQSALSPRFIGRKILSVRNLDDIKFLFSAARRLLGHLDDFRRQSGASSGPG
jgi:radical SAM superfamily enzyme YgiQ (UPF0313 family)